MSKKLFAFDLDGTLLADSQKDLVSPEEQTIIKKLIADGHIVCLITGRPWALTKKVYEQLNLTTLVGNVNGAHIHLPNQEEKFKPIVEEIKIASVQEILKDEKMQQIIENTIIAGLSYMQFDKKEQIKIKDGPTKIKENIQITTPIDYQKMNSNPIGVWIRVKSKYITQMNEITEYFNAKYGDLADFSYWEMGEKIPPILEITTPHAHKDIALIKIARYYNIEMDNVIAFGDGHNDLRMLKRAGLGVAMINGHPDVKKTANIITKFSNKENGISQFLEWFFTTNKKTITLTKYEFKI